MARKGSRSSPRSRQGKSRKSQPVPESPDTMAASLKSPASSSRRSTAPADMVAESHDAPVACVDLRRTELHEFARSVYSRLSAHPALAVEELTVRCSNEAVYLSGSVELLDESVDWLDLAREISGVDEVVSHVIVRRRIPPKG